MAHDGQHEDRLRPDQIARVFIRPIGTVLPVGFLVFGVGAFMSASYSLGWIPVTQGHDVFVLVLAFVVQVQADSYTMQMGVVVDGVAEVLNLAPADIEDTPDFGQGVVTPYLLGMAKVKGKVKILLEIDQVLTSQEMQGIQSALQ